jgi:carboxyvinyl-carboxyphosphonate phosphorylmutase
LPPKDLKRLASSELTARVTRDADVKARLAKFLGSRS